MTTVFSHIPFALRAAVTLPIPSSMHLAIAQTIYREEKRIRCVLGKRHNMK